MRRFTSRKFIMCVMWFVLLFTCIIIDGHTIESHLATICAITGAIVNCCYIIGDYMLKITDIRIQHKDTTVEIKTSGKYKNTNKKVKK